MEISRRGLFASLVALPVAAVAVLKAKPTFSARRFVSQWQQGAPFRKGDVFTIQGSYAVNPKEHPKEYVVVDAVSSDGTYIMVDRGQCL